MNKFFVRNFNSTMSTVAASAAGSHAGAAD